MGTTKPSASPKSLSPLFNCDPIIKGPVVRMDAEVKIIQEAVGLKGKDVDRIFGGGTAKLLREQYGDVTDKSNPALKTMDPALRAAIERIEKRLGRGMFTQDLKEGCHTDKDKVGVEKPLEYKFIPGTDGQPVIPEPTPETKPPVEMRKDFNEEAPPHQLQPVEPPSNGQPHRDIFPAPVRPEDPRFYLRGTPQENYIDVRTSTGFGMNLG